MTAPFIPEAWRKSSACNGASACVRVRYTVEGLVELRSGTDDDGHSIFYTKEEWLAFIEGVKAGDFDDVIPQGLSASPQMDDVPEKVTA